MRFSAKHKPAQVVGTLALVAALLAGFGFVESATPDNPDAGTPAVKVEAVPAQAYVETSRESTGNAISAQVVRSDANLVVRFIDVGQGDATLITCGGESLLIDGGPSSASSKLYSMLDDLGIDHLDYIIATHPDADHCGGISGALNRASCGTFFCSVTEHDTKTFKSVLKYLNGTPVTVPDVGRSFSLGAATVEFVGPVRKTGDSNNDSLVCKVVLGDRSFLFTGDAESESESMIVGSGADIDVDVLKVGHHGSNSSTGVDFLERVTPYYAIVSVGDNDYGHPTSSALQRLVDAQAHVLRTDELGTITIETDGSALSVSSSKGSIGR